MMHFFQKQYVGLFKAFIILSLLLFQFSNVSLAAKLSDEDFLHLLQRKAFDYFWQETSNATGLVRDRAPNWGSDESRVASIAAVGFALTAYPIGIERGWITKEEGYKRTLRTMKFFKNTMEHKGGFYFHFVDKTMGTRAMGSEISSIDTGIFLMGALFAAEYFKGTDVEQIAKELYDRTDFKWMTNGGDSLSMGWKPESGFLTERWNAYDEGILLYWLAIGSTKHPIPAGSWDKIRRQVGRYGQWTLVQSPPLFTHQYPQLWVDLRGVHDKYVNYFENSVKATQANRQFCIDQQDKYPTYSENVWGLSACEGERGYRAYGAPPGSPVHDGTITPYAAGGSIQFTPDISIAMLRNLYDNYKTYLWGNYGFSDALTLKPFWRSRYCYGINVGAMLISIENHRSGFVWNMMKKVQPIQNALNAIGFEAGTKEPVLKKAPVIQVGAKPVNLQIDGDLSDWKGTTPYQLSADHIEFGTPSSSKDFGARFYSAYEGNMLYLAVEVIDDNIVMRRGQQALFKDDAVEVFIDGNQNGFDWHDQKDFQFVLSPRENNKTKTWEALHRMNPVNKQLVIAASTVNDLGYMVEFAIDVSKLGLNLQQGQSYRISVAVHDADRLSMDEDLTGYVSEKQIKVNTFFQSSADAGTHELAFMTLN